MSEDSMAFPNTWEEFEKEYGFTDTEEIYTNGSRLIQTFRVRQWLEHLQAEPVIRCKDCEWYINNILKADGTEDKRFKRSWCEIHRMETNDYGYCHLAYRRKDEGIHSDNREGS